MKLLDLLFPKKCLHCGKLLRKDEADICFSCRSKIPYLLGRKGTIPYVKAWTAPWMYADEVRSSILRFKFRGRRHYAKRYAPYLVQDIRENLPVQPELITYVPVSFLRKFTRGYDQDELLAKALSKELGIPAARTLRKHRHTPPQSSLKDAAMRRANILGAYRPYNPKNYTGKQILLLDDIITTGATASECAKTLLLSGAAEVYCAAVATRLVEK